MPLSAEVKQGICLEYEEGDGFDLQSCRTSSLSDCSKGKKPTAMEGFKGKLFLSTDKKHLSEFQEKPASACKPILVSDARGKDTYLSEYARYILYSNKLKKGDTAYIYGENVNVRETGSIKSEKLFSLNKGTKVEIIGKSAMKQNLEKDTWKAYWFQISVNGKKGWVFGQFIHPNPDSEKPFLNYDDKDK